MEARVIFRGIEWNVQFYYQPEEPQTYDYPGCGEEAQIECIECNGVDFTEFFMEYGTDTEISRVEREFERLVLEEIHKNDY